MEQLTNTERREEPEVTEEQIRMMLELVPEEDLKDKTPEEREQFGRALVEDVRKHLTECFERAVEIRQDASLDGCYFCGEGPTRKEANDWLDSMLCQCLGFRFEVAPREKDPFETVYLSVSFGNFTGSYGLSAFQADFSFRKICAAHREELRRKSADKGGSVFKFLAREGYFPELGDSPAHASMQEWSPLSCVPRYLTVVDLQDVKATPPNSPGTEQER